MFRGEATVLASLDDPNVVRLYEYVESPSGAAIVMELVDGVSLREILTYQGKTTPEAALVVLQGSLLGLAAAHRRGVVHRDYKPENVLVDGDGASKLTDFGIAARAGDRPVPAGTLAYAAPEQMSGAPASPAGDVYAATATFYECLTGRPPFTRRYRRGAAPPASLRAGAPGAGARTAAAAGGRRDGQDPGQTGRPTLTPSWPRSRRLAAGAYGPHWQDRGRSHLGEAALLLAALWPSGAPPAVQGATREERPPARAEPAFPAPAFPRGQGGHRGRHRGDRGRRPRSWAVRLTGPDQHPAQLLSRFRRSPACPRPAAAPWAGAR
jgi:serine/threonine protein kinase